MIIYSSVCCRGFFSFFRRAWDAYAKTMIQYDVNVTKITPCRRNFLEEKEFPQGEGISSRRRNIL